MQIVKKLARKLRGIKSQKGFTLIEAVIGTALLVIIGVAVLTGVSTAFKASATTDKISTALAIAQSQIEHMQSQDYICATNGNAAYKRIAVPNGYSISSIYLVGGVETEWPSASSDPPIVYAVKVNAAGTADINLQKITVKVYQINNSNPVTIVAYKIKPTAEDCP